MAKTFFLPWYTRKDNPLWLESSCPCPYERCETRKTKKRFKTKKELKEHLWKEHKQSTLAEILAEYMEQSMNHIDARLRLMGVLDPSWVYSQAATLLIYRHGVPLSRDEIRAVFLIYVDDKGELKYGTLKKFSKDFKIPQRILKRWIEEKSETTKKRV